MNRKKTGSALRVKRKKLGISLEDMADKMQLSPSTLSLIERGMENVKDEKYEDYAKQLGCSHLVGVVEEVEKKETELNNQLQKIVQIIIANPTYGRKKLQQLNNSEDLKIYPNINPIYLFLLGRCFFEDKDWLKAEEMLLNVLKEIKKSNELNSSNLEAACWNELSRISYFQNKIKQALQFTKNGLKCFKPNGDRLHYYYFLLLNQAVYYEKLNKMEKALQATERLENAIKSLNRNEIHLYVRTSVLIQMYDMYATIYNKMDSQEKALKYVEKGIRISWINQDFDRLFTLLTTKGNILHKLNRTTEAEEHYKMAFDIRPKVKQKYLLPYNFTNLGVLLLEQGKLEEAKKVVNKAIETSEKNNDLLSQTKSFLIMGKWYIKQNLFNEAIPLFKKAEKIAEEHHFSGEYSEAILYLCYCYEKQQEYSNLQEYALKLYKHKKLTIKE